MVQLQQSAGCGNPQTSWGSLMTFDSEKPLARNVVHHLRVFYFFSRSGHSAALLTDAAVTLCLFSQAFVLRLSDTAESLLVVGRCSLDNSTRRG
jgi:hypothetical protein